MRVMRDEQPNVRRGATLFSFPFSLSLSLSLLPLPLVLFALSRSADDRDRVGDNDAIDEDGISPHQRESVGGKDTRVHRVESKSNK